MSYGFTIVEVWKSESGSLSSHIEKFVEVLIAPSRYKIAELKFHVHSYNATAMRMLWSIYL